jgi:hypothetical protein
MLRLNKIYAKIINGEYIEAPYEKDGVYNYNINYPLLELDGWKRVVFTPKPNDGENYIEDYTETNVITVNWKIEIPKTITQAQGKLLLNMMGIYELVEQMIQQGGNEEKIYWEYWIEWRRDSPIINRLALNIWPENTIENLDNFFIQAGKIN